MLQLYVFQIYRKLIQMKLTKKKLIEYINKKIIFIIIIYKIIYLIKYFFFSYIHIYTYLLKKHFHMFYKIQEENKCHIQNEKSIRKYKCQFFALQIIYLFSLFIFQPNNL